ncbi:unnamed protein product [Vicia faba]|uniref:Uncharacterized protein n=1 Tax=Vicia faba TaxID=3906 RepID=A0AAV0ZZW4_VICFA|nr:unnamed protein product [Vicia faba]
MASRTDLGVNNQIVVIIEGLVDFEQIMAQGFDLQSVVFQKETPAEVHASSAVEDFLSSCSFLSILFSSFVCFFISWRISFSRSFFSALKGFCLPILLESKDLKEKCDLVGYTLLLYRSFWIKINQP